MAVGEPDTDELIRSAKMGDLSATSSLLGRHRTRLRNMLAMRMDPRLKQRIDPSDIVQETLIDAARRLPDYLSERVISFYPWLRGIAWNRLVDLHRKHILAKNRSVNREVSLDQLNDKSEFDLVEHLLVSTSEPAEQMMQREMRLRIRTALSRLTPDLREILVLRHLEDLSVVETAEVLGISEGTVKSRHFRAAARLRVLLDEP